MVDIDPRNGGSENIGELEKRYGRLPSTRLSRTAHFGIHRFYAHPKDGTYPNAIQLDKLPGIDVRSDGGYVVIPPSRLGKLQYRWVKEAFPIAPAPKWLLDLIKHSPNNNLPVERPLPTGKKWIDHYLPQANEGNRNAIGFQIICQWRDDGVPEATASVWILEFVERVPQGKSPYLAREALASVRSAYRRPARPPARRG